MTCGIASRRWRSIPGDALSGAASAGARRRADHPALCPFDGRGVARSLTGGGYFGLTSDTRGVGLSSPTSISDSPLERSVTSRAGCAYFLAKPTTQRKTPPVVRGRLGVTSRSGFKISRKPNLAPYSLSRVTESVRHRSRLQNQRSLTSLQRRPK